MDHGRGAGGWKRENQVMDDGIFMVLGIISEIFINPNFSALIFQLF